MNNIVKIYHNYIVEFVTHKKQCHFHEKKTVNFHHLTELSLAAVINLLSCWQRFFATKSINDC